MAAELFGWLSAGAAVLLVWKRFAFLRQSLAAQRRWALGAWILHVGAFLALVGSLAYLF